MQPQPQPRPSRVLKPSSQQQARTASPPRSAAPASTKPKAAATTPSSVLTRDRLQSNLKYYQFLTRVQHLLIDSSSVPASTLQRALLVLRPVDFEEVAQERSSDGRCGWPACGNEVQQDTKAKGRYRLSMRQQRVWEVEGGRRYCSERCEEDSADYAVQLKEEPLYMRRLGDMMTAMQHDEQKQQTAQEVLAALPTHSAAHSDYDALKQALQSTSNPSSLVIKENSEQSVLPIVGGQPAAIEGYSHQQPPQRQSQPSPSPPTRPSVAAGKLASAATSSRRVSLKPAAPRTVESAPKLQSTEPPSVSELSDEDELLDAIARTAISEKAKLHQQLNRLSDATAQSPAAVHSAGEDDSNQPTADEAKQNFAAMRQANPLSPFAQLAGLLTHYVTDDTVALLRSAGSTDVAPASSELVRRRQEALLGSLHGELRGVCEELAVRGTRAVEDAVDAVGLTFLLNEPVPALSSRLWQVVVAVILVALHRRSGGSTFDMDEQAAIKFVGMRGLTDVHLAALMDILLPPSNFLAPQASTTQPLHAVTANATIAASPVASPATASSLLSMPRYLLSSALSFLGSSDLLAASLVCCHFRLLCHPLRQHSDERALLVHNSSLASTRMHTLGYREGVQEGRELLMQAGFDAGVLAGWRSGRAEQWKSGVVGALSMWSEAGSAGWSAADVERLWQQCERMNGAVMRRPKGRGGKGSISVAAAEEGKAAEEDAAEAWQERCVQLIQQLGGDGRQLFERLAADMEEGKDAHVSSETVAVAEEREVDARIIAAIGGDVGVSDSRPDDSSGGRPDEAAAADDFM